MARIIHTFSGHQFSFEGLQTRRFFAGGSLSSGGKGVVGPSSWPSPAEEELQDKLSFDEWLTPRKESSFLLSVGSKDMQEAGIMPGDTLVVERGYPAGADDIVVVDLRGSWRMRRLKQKNENLSDVENEDFRLIGTVTAVIRKYH